MRRIARIALLTVAFACGLAGLRQLAANREPPQAFVRGEPAERPAADAPPLEPAEPLGPLVAFGGTYGQPGGSVSPEEGQAHYALGSKLLGFGDYYSAASHLALAREALGDHGRTCELLAIAYDRLNMTLDLLELMPCLEREAREREPLRPLYDRLRQQLDVEVDFAAAASDHFVASFPADGPSAESIGEVLDLLERTRLRIAGEVGFASVRLVPVVVYEGEQFAEATDKPHWASGIYDGKIRIGIDLRDKQPELFEKALAHEYVHALTHEYTGTRLPSWFREGLADELARRRGQPADLRSALLASDGPPPEIDELSGEFASLPGERALLVYRLSQALVGNLVREAGWSAVHGLLGDLREDRELEFDAAFTDLYGESPSDYLDRWYDTRAP